MSQAENPNWCEECKGYVIWSPYVAGPWCSCSKGAAAREALGDLLDPLQEVGKSIAKLAEAITADMHKGLSGG